MVPSMKIFLKFNILISNSFLLSSFALQGGARSAINFLTSRRTNRQITKFAHTHTLKMANDNIDSKNPLDEMDLPSPLILGSGSFTRKLILSEMKIPYILKVRPIDERNLGDRSDGSDPEKLVLLLANAKNEALVEGLLDPNIKNGSDDPNETHEKYQLTLPPEMEKSLEEGGEGCIILTADQVVTHANAILEKPDDIDQAKEFVTRYADEPPSTVGSVVLTHLPSRISVCGVDTSTIRFKPSVVQTDLIDRLLEDGAPVLSCAGGLMVEHPFVVEHIEGIDGTQNGVMGLSKDLVLRLLKDLKQKLDNVL